MDHLKGSEITGPMIQEVVDSMGFGMVRCWLVRKDGVWSVVEAGSVDGSEEHVLTQHTIWGQTIRRKEGERWRFEYELAAMGFNSMFFKR